MMKIRLPDNEQPQKLGQLLKFSFTINVLDIYCLGCSSSSSSSKSHKTTLVPEQIKLFESKCKSDGTLERYKVRLVAKGYTQTYGIDYEEIFALVVKMNMFPRAWFGRFAQVMIFLGYKQSQVKHEGPIKLLCDNNSAMSIVHNLVQHDRTKHIKIDRHFIKKKLNGGLVVTTHVPLGLQVTNVFTKGLPVARFQERNDKLGMIDIHLPT
ncbi:Copia protein, partial [Mucuna pruriens]